MPQYKGTVIFTAGNSGWTETYYPVLLTSAGAISNLIFVITSRLSLLHADCILQAATISDVSKRGDSINVFDTPEAGHLVDANGYLVLDSAVCVKWQVGIYNRNKTFMRGLPIGQTLDGFLNLSSPVLTAFDNFFAEVIANCVFPVTVVNPAPPPRYLIDHFSPVTAGSTNARLARRKAGRPFGLPRGRRVAP